MGCGMNVPAEQRHVLLIDAETYVWDVIRHGLGPDYRTSAVASRSAALRVINQNPPDIIIVELVLPKAPGLPIAIYALHRRIPVVLTTSKHELGVRLVRLGAVVLCKPYSVVELRECIADAVIHPGSNLARNDTALQRVRSDRREREAMLRLFGDMRDQMTIALRSVPQSS